MLELDFFREKNKLKTSIALNINIFSHQRQSIQAFNALFIENKSLLVDKKSIQTIYKF